MFGGCQKKNKALRYVYKGAKSDSFYNPNEPGGDTVWTLADEPRTPSTLDMVPPTAADAAIIAWTVLRRIYSKENKDFNTKYKTLEISLVNNSVWRISAEGTWKVEHIDIRKKDGKILGYYGTK